MKLGGKLELFSKLWRYSDETENVEFPKMTIVYLSFQHEVVGNEPEIKNSEAYSNCNNFNVN